MDWVCPLHHAPLRRADESTWSCAECGEGYPVLDGVPHFDSASAAPVPELDEFARQLRRSGLEPAVELFCRDHQCARNPFSTDWKFLLPVGAEGAIAELGPGFADDALFLRQQSEALFLATPNASNARLVAEHLELRDPEESGAPVRTFVTGDGTRLPLADDSLTALAIEDVAFAGFGLGSGTIDAAAREWRRVVRDDGAVLVGVANGLTRLPGAREAIRLLHSKKNRQSMNRRVKELASRERSVRLGRRRVVRAMCAAGFAEPLVYAPLPDEKRTEIVVPIEDRRAVSYFLNHLIRQNSPIVRTAIAAANVALRLGLFGSFVPYYYLIFRAAEGEPIDA